MQAEFTAPATPMTAALIRAPRHTALRYTLALYAIHLTLFTLIAVGISALFPKTDVERQIAVWPPSAPLGAWLDRVVLHSVQRYDVNWYLGIAEHGYGHKAGDTAFHPAFPVLGGLLGRALGGRYDLGLWLVNQICCVAMLVVLYTLVQQRYDVGTARRATLLLMCSPLGFVFLMPYTESMLLLGIVGAMLAAARGHWLVAGACGALAVLTKQPGAVVALPVLYELWQREGANLRAGRVRGTLHGLAGVALIPLGLAGWLVYRGTLGDVMFDWSQPQTLVSALLVSPDFANIWTEYFSWPWVNAGYALDQMATRPYYDLVINVVLMLAMLVVACRAIWRQRGGAAIFTAVIILLNLSIVFPEYPYMSVVRRFTIIYPIFIQLALWSHERKVLVRMVELQAVCWIAIAAMVVRNSYVP